MKQLDKRRISLWMHRNAREIDLARWKYLFEEGDKMDVVNALMQYQNPDGGFGNAVDPDNWNINSVPYATLYAMNILKEIDFFDFNHPIYKGICRYLDKESNYPDGWTFTIESNKDYPHANYYNYNAEYNKVESTGIFLGFSSFIIERYKSSAIYDDILNKIRDYMDLMFDGSLGDMGPSGYIILVDAMKRAGIEGYDYKQIECRLKELVNDSIQRNPKEWLNYGYRPSDYIKSKDSIFYDDNKDIIDVELDFLCDTLPENDVWPISWSWFDNNEVYPIESSISGMWSKSYKAIEKSIFLNNFGRLIY